ncbi:hypothetical protein WH47_06354 [Habropoda laboriosa]|uniref:Uncharacterized protein n=2 Tax=Habropoda laboriosa TaxID=597456 RepID=A0A0L7RCJ8_9HYME|nr:hypothetical protein WH47_06354 [Habropoda laboriosa]
MMDCEGDRGGYEELVDLATDVADSSSTIRDAAERLLTLLGVDEDHEDLLSSSEDEGVELDELEDEEEEEEDETENNRLLHQLAASLAKELKQSHHQKQTTSTRLSTSRDHQIATTETGYLEHSCLQEQNIKGTSCYRDSLGDKRHRQDTSRSYGKQDDIFESYQRLEGRLWMDQEAEVGNSRREQVPGSWNAGWDACATEALRYLVEDEGLPPHHPTVLAMKDHLELQRERTFAQYTA